jgi:DNA-binding IclR family transcriptional regulator
MSPARLLTSTLKCLALLDTLADYPDAVGVSELGRARGLGRGTVYQQLSTLVGAGWVEQVEDGRYRLTLRATRLGHQALEMADMGLRIRPHLETLARSTGEAVSVAVFDIDAALIVQRIEPAQVLRVEIGVGTRMPLATSASGRILVAFGPDYRAQRLRERGIPLPAEDVIASARALGFAIQVDEYMEDVFGVAVPLFDLDGDLLAALSCAGPSSRFNPELAIEPLKECAEGISTLPSDSGQATARNVGRIGYRTAPARFLFE